MSLFDNDRIQEAFLVIGDKFTPEYKKWWYALAVAIVAAIPFYYLVKFAFVQYSVSIYNPPRVISSTATQDPLQVIETKNLGLGNNTYGGYAKVKNINLDWGSTSQAYTVTFKTFGGTILNQYSDQTFILPSSEKLIVFRRFVSSTRPDEVSIVLDKTHFIHKTNAMGNFELERITTQNKPDGLVVSAGIKNLTAFTIRQISLPVAVYNNKNEIVAVNYTNINDVKSGETRTFQYSWPSGIDGAIRSEINPEINIFDRNLFSTQEGVSPFENSQ